MSGPCSPIIMVKPRFPGRSRGMTNTNITEVDQVVAAIREARACSTMFEEYFTSLEEAVSSEDPEKVYSAVMDCVGHVDTLYAGYSAEHMFQQRYLKELQVCLMLWVAARNAGHVRASRFLVSLAHYIDGVKVLAPKRVMR